MNNRRIATETIFGKIIAETSTDPNYPGITLFAEQDCEDTGVKVDKQLALLEATPNMPVKGGHSLRLLVWNSDDEDFTDDFTFLEEIPEAKAPDVQAGMERFERPGPGECIVLERSKRVPTTALVLRPANRLNPYVVAIYFEPGADNWGAGKYFSNLEDALSEFRSWDNEFSGCELCGNHQEDGLIEATDYGGRKVHVCDDCRHENFEPCEECGEYMRGRFLQEQDMQYLCKACFGEQ